MNNPGSTREQDGTSDQTEAYQPPTIVSLGTTEEVVAGIGSIHFP